MKARETLHGILTELRDVRPDVNTEINNTISDLFRSGLRAYDMKVSDELFHVFPDNLKDKYIVSFDVTANKFNSCSNELKEKYINRCIRNNWGLNPQLFNWCSDALKTKHVAKVTSDCGSLPDYQFAWCSPELKKKYLLTKLEHNLKSYYKRIDEVFEYAEMCSEELLRELVTRVVASKSTISDVPFRKLSTDNKAIYVHYRMTTDYELSDTQFIACPELLKKDYLKKSRKLSEMQIDYLRNNYCTF